MQKINQAIALKIQVGRASALKEEYRCSTNCSSNASDSSASSQQHIRDDISQMFLFKSLNLYTSSDENTLKLRLRKDFV